MPLTPSRKPVIGPSDRTHKVNLQLNDEEIAALDELVIKRRCQSRQDYIRLMIESDHFSELMIVDDAFARICRIVGQGFGGAASELTAMADAYRLSKKAGEF